MKITVPFIYEALIVKLDPNAVHGEGCSFINGIEQGINNAGPLGGLLAMASSLDAKRV